MRQMLEENQSAYWKCIIIFKEIQFYLVTFWISEMFQLKARFMSPNMYTTTVLSYTPLTTHHICLSIQQNPASLIISTLGSYFSSEKLLYYLVCLVIWIIANSGLSCLQ